MHLRRLVRADASTYRTLMLEGYAMHPDAFTSTVAERGPLPLAWWEARLADGDADELVIGAWNDDALVGVAGLRLEVRPRSRHKALLYGMYVRASVAGRGVGTRLVDAVLDEARRRRGVRLVQLTVSDGNARAEALYRSRGFVRFGVEPLAIAGDDGYVAKIHMWVDLEGRPAPDADA